jgi:hypothetical protein
MANSKSAGKSRVHILATLGAELHRLGLGRESQDALRAALSLPLGDVIANLESDEVNSLTFGDALVSLVQSDIGPLSELGRAILHDRRAAEYRADCASWAAQPEALKNGSWRRLHPTRDQRMLMIRMAEQLGVRLPGDVDRGQAQVWIADHGGNPRFNEENYDEGMEIIGRRQ